MIWRVILLCLLIANQALAVRLASEHNAFTGATIAYQYDELGRSTNRSIDSVGDGVAFDGLGRLLAHYSNLGEVDLYYSAYPAIPANVPVEIDYPNNEETLYTYTNTLGDDRRTGIFNGSTDTGGTYTQFGYTHDVLGRVTHFSALQSPIVEPGMPGPSPDTDRYGGAGASGDSTLTNLIHSYSYDGEGQVLEDQVSAWTNNTSLSTNIDYAYGYDLAGNRVAQQRQHGPAASETFPATGGGTTTALAVPTYASAVSYNNVNQMTARNGSGTVPVYLKGSANEPVSVTVNGTAAPVTGASVRPHY